MNDEIFKTINEFPNYKISNHGRLYNKKKDKFLNGTVDKSGNIIVGLFKDKKQKKKKLKHLVADAFVPNLENKTDIKHIDNNKKNNKYDNLKWCYKNEYIIFKIYNMDLYKNEIYKDIPNFEYYYITSYGRIFSKTIKTYLKPNFKDGYYYVILCNKKERKKYLIHRLLALTFIPNPQNLKFVDHIDRNTKNNSLENLRWVSLSENNINKLQSNKYFKNIYKRGNSWQIFINNSRCKYDNCFSNKTLEDVKKIRDKIYLEYNLPILD